MNIRSLLVANRGEIAVRVMRACRELGVRAVAVYSEADRDAPHVAMADDALCIGPAPAAASYLDVQAVADAASRAGVDAVHPGYGFLSENPRLPAALEARGIVFVGPPAHVIERMGSKQRARGAAADAGVPVVPGYDGAAQDLETLASAADRVGYPLMIKASAGGGGRGMRRVFDRSAFASQLDLARGEARAAFGDDTVLLERLVERARHVEVQVLADAHGNVVHLFDRDCSVQRHHQKIIEEAPAPALAEKPRRAMLDQAVALARGIGYVNAGTVEYIHDVERDAVYFLEMNTRLQVEHPVTEMVTGIDIVAWQIRIAGGEPLGFSQDDIRCEGHAIEARIAAEDPAGGFRPCTGRVVDYAEPAGANVRVDSGIGPGSEITHHYDSMVAKVICHGKDRDTARLRLHRALDALRIAGVGTNRRFLAQVIGRPAFVDATHATDLLDGTCVDESTLSARQLAETVLAQRLSGARDADDPWRHDGAWRITAPAGRPGIGWYRIKAPGADQCDASIEEQDGRFVVAIDGVTALDALAPRFADGWLDYDGDARRHRVRIVIENDRTWHAADGATPVTVSSAEHDLLAVVSPAADRSGVLRAPMPGTVAEIRVAAGDTVRAGQVVYVLEAMKMYQEQLAPRDGLVTAVRRGAGDHVDGGAVVVELDARTASTTR